MLAIKNYFEENLFLLMNLLLIRYIITWKWLGEFFAYLNFNEKMSMLSKKGKLNLKAEVQITELAVSYEVISLQVWNFGLMSLPNDIVSGLNYFDMSSF